MAFSDKEKKQFGLQQILHFAFLSHYSSQAELQQNLKIK